MPEALEGPLPISREHLLEEFDCGSPALDEYLKRYARQNHERNLARTYCILRGQRVVAWHTLTFGAVGRDEASGRITRRLPRYPIPVMILARLAVDGREQGHGLGRALLKDAMLRTLQAADIAGLKAMLVHVKDERVKRFYEQLGFEPSPTHELHLFLSIEDIRGVCGEDVGGGR